MGSSDYLNSARRAAIVFLLLASSVVGAAGYGLAVSVWGGDPVAPGAGAKAERGSAGDVCRERPAPRVANLRVAQGPFDRRAGL